jgi:hypothetical protein
MYVSWQLLLHISSASPNTSPVPSSALSLVELLNFKSLLPSSLQTDNAYSRRAHRPNDFSQLLPNPQLPPYLKCIRVLNVLAAPYDSTDPDAEPIRCGTRTIHLSNSPQFTALSLRLGPSSTGTKILQHLWGGRSKSDSKLSFCYATFATEAWQYHHLDRRCVHLSKRTCPRNSNRYSSKAMPGIRCGDDAGTCTVLLVIFALIMS